MPRVEPVVTQSVFAGMTEEGVGLDDDEDTEQSAKEDGAPAGKKGSSAPAKGTAAKTAPAKAAPAKEVPAAKNPEPQDVSVRLIRVGARSWC
jgi:hypothetical protein